MLFDGVKSSLFAIVEDWLLMLLFVDDEDDDANGV
jgi:hypothetical protein